MFVVWHFMLPAQNRAQDGFYFKELRWYRGLIPEERENTACGGRLRVGCRSGVFIDKKPIVSLTASEMWLLLRGQECPVAKIRWCS